MSTSRTLDAIDSSDSDDSLEECMKVFLNGLSISDVSWREDVESTNPAAQTLPQDPVRSNTENVITNSLLNEGFDKHKQQQIVEENWTTSTEDEDWCNHAYTTNTPDLRPPHMVRIVDHSIYGRGYALMATQLIPAGTVLYTERALFASQIPEYATASVKDHPHCQYYADRYPPSIFKVLACQHCFRSLEPISSCYLQSYSQTAMSTTKKDEELDFGELFPLPQLYPIPDFQWDRSTVPISTHRYRIDAHGRILCSQCDTLFCSLSCYNAFHEQYGSCCCMFQMMHHLPFLLRPSNDIAGDISTHPPKDDSNGSNVERDDDFFTVQPAIPLAIRMFVAILQWHRTNSSKSNVSSRLPNLVNGLCGAASNIQTLELGIPHNNRTTGNDEANSRPTLVYTLEPIYSHLVQVYSLTIEEQHTLFSLEFFMSVTAKAARNGFGLRTQSPFQTYYAAVVRSCYSGRGSDRHQQTQRTIARALGSANGSLERDMDRKVNEQVSPEIVAFFPLTSRINHSCRPNTEVRSQQFVDSYIDLVAKTDIAMGTEISISYIHIGRKSTLRRQRELYAKYMFQCTCTLCVPAKTDCYGGKA